MARLPVASGTSWSGLGVNYGSDVVYDVPFRTSEVKQDIATIAQVFSGIRIHIPPPSTPQWVLNNIAVVIGYAKAAGLQTLWGSTANGGDTLTATNWSAYVTAVLSRATLAAQYGVDDFTIGNEDEYRIDGTTLTAATFRSNLKALATSVKSRFNGTVSYTVSQNHTFGWISDGKGSIDKLGLNVYGSNTPYDPRYFIYILSTFYKAFGASMYIAEFNITDDWTSLSISEAEKCRYLKVRINYIRRLGVAQAYYFIYAHRSTNQFSLKLSSGDFSDMWWALTNRRHNFVGVPNVPVWQTRHRRP
jgi:hypothetical protein